jgi:hypothetical protein
MMSVWTVCQMFIIDCYVRVCFVIVMITVWYFICLFAKKKATSICKLQTFSAAVSHAQLSLHNWYVLFNRIIRFFYHMSFVKRLLFPFFFMHRGLHLRWHRRWTTAAIHCYRELHNRTGMNAFELHLMTGIHCKTVWKKQALQTITVHHQHVFTKHQSFFPISFCYSLNIDWRRNWIFNVRRNQSNRSSWFPIC